MEVVYIGPRGFRRGVASFIVAAIALIFVVGVVTSASPESSRPRSASGANRPRTAEPAVAPESPLQLWVGGCSLAAGPSWAVHQAALATGVIDPIAEYQVGTGLVRSEYWNWSRHMEGVLAARDPDIVVFMVGANDNQPLAVDDVSYRPGDPQWNEEYRRRVGHLMDVLSAGGRPVIWIGMPPMRDIDLSEAMGLIDTIFAEEAAKREGIAYIDTWALFSAPDALGTYTHSLPFFSGPVDVRLEDGIHLNVEGSQIVAGSVMEQLGDLGLV
jgi:uncharacterized protein